MKAMLESDVNMTRISGLLALCVAMTFGTTAFGAISHSYEDNDATLVVNVDSGSETMVDTWVTSPDSTTGAAVTKIKKTGAGTLVAVPIPSFTGDFSIEAGGYSYLSVGDFGATSDTASSGVIDIKEGAKILHGATSGVKNDILSGKTVNLYGGTAPNIEIRTQGVREGYNMTIVLKADAGITRGCWGRTQYYGTLDLFCHTFTIEGTGSAEVIGTVLNPGKILVKGGLMAEVGTELDSSTAGTVEISGGGGNLSTVYLGRLTDNGWTLLGNNATISTRRNVTWTGPFESEGNTKLADVDHTVDITGSVTGSGKLRIGPGRVNFHGANTYSGEVTVLGRESTYNKGGIGFYNGASCFPDASSVTFTNGAYLGFMDDVASAVPAVTFACNFTQSIFGGTHTNRSTISAITKTGSGILVVEAPVHVTGTTLVKEGTLKVATGPLGLYEEYASIKRANMWSGNPVPPYDAFAPWSTPDNILITREDLGVNREGAARCYHKSGDSGWNWPPSIDASDSGKDAKNYYWYHGYVWNYSDQPVTCKILSGMQPGTYVWFGEDHATQMVFDNRDSNYAVPQEVILQPGKTRIDIAIWSWGGTNGGATYSRYNNLKLSYAVNTEWECSEWDTAKPGDKLNDFKLFAQSSLPAGSEDKPLFTARDFEENELPVFDNLVFSSGATLDLSSNTVFQVANLTGSPLVTNAPVFKVTNNWTICAADFPTVDSAVRNPMVVDGRLVFTAGSTFSVDDESLICREGVVVATATGGVQGRPTAATGSENWSVIVSGNNVLLVRRVGLTIVVR